MSSQAAAKGRTLPKFGEWAANNPEAAGGYTVIFDKARDQKKTNGAAAGGGVPVRKVDGTNQNSAPRKDKRPRRWLCWCYV